MPPKKEPAGASSGGLHPMDPLDPSLPATCADCNGQDFHYYGLLERHRAEVHSIPEATECGQCSNTFRRRMNLVLHWRSKAHKDAFWIGCDICDAFIITNGFESEDALRAHTDKVHGEGLVVNNKDVNGGPFVCPFCDSCSFVHRKGMIEHFQVIHADHFYGHMLGESGAKMQELMNRLLIPCPDCPDKFFRVRSTLNRHREKVHNDYLHWANHPNKGHGIPKEALEAIKRIEEEEGESVVIAAPSRKRKKSAKREKGKLEVLNASFPVRRAKSLGGDDAPKVTLSQQLKRRRTAGGGAKPSPRSGLARKASSTPARRLVPKTTAAVPKPEPAPSKSSPPVTPSKCRPLVMPTEDAPSEEDEDDKPLSVAPGSSEKQLKLTQLWGGKPSPLVAKKPLTLFPLNPKPVPTSGIMGPGKVVVPSTSSGGSSSGPVSCPHCGKEFSRASILNIHVEMIHKNQQAATSSPSSAQSSPTKPTTAGAIAAPTANPVPKRPSLEAQGDVLLKHIQGAKPAATEAAAAAATPKIEEPTAASSPSPSSSSPSKKGHISAAEWLAKKKMNGFPSTKPKSHQFNSILVAAAAARRRAGLPSGSLAAAQARRKLEEDDDTDVYQQHPNLVKKKSYLSDDEDTEFKTSAKVSNTQRASTRIRSKRTSDEATSSSENTAPANNGSTEDESGDQGEEAEETPAAKRLREQAEEESTFAPWEPRSEPRPKEELIEECVYECGRWFTSYFNMMRHVAFHHRAERTLKLMRLKAWEEDEGLLVLGKKERRSASQIWAPAPTEEAQAVTA